MAENKLADLSMDFAVEILKICDSIKGHYSIVNRLERRATANIREAKYAHSKPDFISKIQISLKECYETEYRLKLMHRAELLSVISKVMHNCGVIRKMLIYSITPLKRIPKNQNNINYLRRHKCGGFLFVHFALFQNFY